jgi:hypothetical protein
VSGARRQWAALIEGAPGAAFLNFNLLVFAIGDFDRLRIDCNFEARQKAHSQQPVDALTKGALAIRLDDDRDIIGLKRA